MLLEWESYVGNIVPPRSNISIQAQVKQEEESRWSSNVAILSIWKKSIRPWGLQ